MRFDFPEQVPLARLPTPLQRLDRLSRRWGADVWIKRDDLTGAALSGNKIRKLEFVFGAHRGKTAVVTCGGAQSNHARATAIAARRLGIVPHLVLRTPDGKAPAGDAGCDGNVLLDRLVGAEITWVTPADYRDRRGEIMQRIAGEMRARGLDPFVVPEGASDATGALGYVAMVEELRGQLGSEGPARFDALVHACGSGGTTAGMAIGVALFGVRTRVVALAVCDDEAYFTRVIGGIVRDFAARHPGAVREEDVRWETIDRWKGVGYAQSTREELDFLRMVGETEGILLDPVYSGKAFRGLAKEIEAGTFARGSTLCFVHTGGIFGLFPKRAELLP